ncbi:MAG: J domain-containing protein [Pseudomonadota bacterium]
MPKVHSHYENLKVARDASAEDIRVAYRALTRKHHPDRNPDNADAERVMSVVNVAYGVLSDPVKRSEHDRWIARTEAAPPTGAAARQVRGKPTVHTPTDRYLTTPSELERMAAQRARHVRLDRRVRRVVAHLLRHRVSYAIGGLIALCLAGAGLSSLIGSGVVSPTAGMPAPGAQAVPVLAGYVRAPAAPNGRPWPSQSGYVDGYPLTNTGGLSEVLVDNAGNDTDMFAKLVSLDGPSALPVRTFFIAARSRFTLSGLTIGTYDLRYRNLASGGLLRSPAFILEEVRTAGGTQHSMPTMKMYKTSDGSLQTYSLGDAEF